MKFMKACWTDIEILMALQQDARTYTGNLMYVIRLQVYLGDSLAKKIFQSVAALFWKWVLRWMDTLENAVWVLIFL